MCEDEVQRLVLNFSGRYIFGESESCLCSGSESVSEYVSLVHSLLNSVSSQKMQSKHVLWIKILTTRSPSSACDYSSEEVLRSIYICNDHYLYILPIDLLLS